MFLTGLNGWAFVYEISGCEIDSCSSYLNFRYHACFGQGAPWHSDNYRVYIHSKTWMWHDKNTQFKNFLALYSFLSIYIQQSEGISDSYQFIYSKVKASQILINLYTAKWRHLRFFMMEQLQSRLARIGSKRFLFIWSEKHYLSFIFIR